MTEKKLVTIARALKEKNRIAGRLAKARQLVGAENSKDKKVARRIDVAAVREEARALAERLVAIKSALAVANTPIVGKIIELDEVKGEIVFDNVEFSYTKSRKIIDKVSFKVEAGKTLGIVGHTGSGKSTLANLLIRLYDVDEGSITVDGVNVKDIAFDDLRNNIAIVSQETYLFVGTIYDNIRYANYNATREEVIEAAKAAGAHDFIVKLPDAYDTMVGFGHKDLSGGEKQRVSIARALLRKPKILILDEATAAMDTQTERRIQNTLDALSKGRTTIMIAHRLSTLKNADSLIVVSGGKVTEVGTHAELLAKKGEYYKLYKLQLDALKNVGVTE